ncbi:MAG: hypothetical protein ACRDTE_11170 [Pseudonocardiaceae bacterium]
MAVWAASAWLRIVVPMYCTPWPVCWLQVASPVSVVRAALPAWPTQIASLLLAVRCRLAPKSMISLPRW